MVIMFKKNTAIRKSSFLKLFNYCLFGLICFQANTTFASDSVSDNVDCSIVEDVSESMMQIHQSGFDVNQAEINEQDLDPTQIFIVQGVIQDIQSMPIFQSKSELEKEYLGLVNKWNKICTEKLLENSDQSHHEK